MAHLSRFAPKMGHPTFGCFCLQGFENRGFCRAFFGIQVFRLWLITGGDISAMSCEAFEDRLEDGASEDNHILRLRLIGCWLCLGRRRYGDRVFGRWSGRLLYLLVRVAATLLFLRVVGEIGTGDLEGVEEETGTAGVDVVRGDASENLAECVLDAVSTAGYGKLEPVASGLPLLRIGDGSAGVVMVVAKFFSP